MVGDEFRKFYARGETSAMAGFAIVRVCEIDVAASVMSAADITPSHLRNIVRQAAFTSFRQL